MKTLSLQNQAAPQKTTPLMMTWRMWRLLHNPNFDHPIFRYHRQSRQSVRLKVGVSITALVGLMMAIGALLISPSNTLFLLLLLVMSAPLLLLALNGLFFGIYFTLTVADGLATQNRLASSDLMQLTPTGTLGLSFLIASARLYRGNRLYKLHRFLRSVAVVGFLACVVVALILLASIWTDADAARYQNITSNWMATVVTIAAVFLLIYLEHVQSTVIAAFSSMIATALSKTNAISLNLLSVLIFFGSHLLPYFVLAWELLLLRIGLGETWHNSMVQILIVIAVTIQLYLFREVIITMCWHWLTTWHRATLDDATSL